MADDAMAEILPGLGESMAKDLLDRAAGFLEGARTARQRFEGVIRAEWGKALDLLEVVVQGFYEFGRDHLIAIMEAGRPADVARVDALGRLHARAVRTATEVLRLLEAGLADGALARWRTLHEVTIVALALNEHGPELSERYLLHEAVRISRMMRDLNTHAVALGWEPFDEADRRTVDQKVAKLEARFGRVFTSTDFGWIDGIIPVKRKGKPSLADLERAVKLEKFRPFFGWASESVHGGVQGLKSLGMPSYVGDHLYAGGSTSGLADPGQNTVISLAQFTAMLVSRGNTIDWLARGEALLVLSRKCQEEFLAANANVEAKTRANVEGPGASSGEDV